MGVSDTINKIFARTPQPTTPSVEQTLEKMYESGELDDWYLNKASPDPKSRIDAYNLTQGMSQFYRSIFSSVQKVGEIPAYGDLARDQYLENFWRDESILAGALYSMTAKMTALSWTVTGPARTAKSTAEMVAGAITMGPRYDWGDFISATALDFYTSNRGVFWETIRKDSGALHGLSHIDSLKCEPTGRKDFPVIYHSNFTGQEIRFTPRDVISFVSLKSAREEHLGMGLCAVDRAYRAAKLLTGLHKYDEEKLANLPPEGVAAVSGLTSEDFQDALTLWKAARERNDSLTFPQVLWLIGSVPNANVGLDFIGFSQMPESFDRRTVVEQYINVLALAFGVDAREFWPVSSGSLGTAAESEIQHMKAKGKGPGEFLSIIERQINGELQEHVNFGFDTQDIAEDLQKATVAQAWINALLPLTSLGTPGRSENAQTPKASMTQTGSEDTSITDTKANPFTTAKDPRSSPRAEGTEGEGFITKDEFMRLLADHGVLPNWLVKDERTVEYDSQVRKKEILGIQEVSNAVQITWKSGKLKVARMPSYSILTKTAPETSLAQSRVNVPQAVAKTLTEPPTTSEEPTEPVVSPIIGDPVDPSESDLEITAKVIASEIDRWSKHPLLKDYVPE